MKNKAEHTLIYKRYINSVTQTKHFTRSRILFQTLNACYEGATSEIGNMDTTASRAPASKGALNFSLAIISTTILSSVLLGLFLWRMYLRWTVKCQSKNRLDGKTVIITGIYQLFGFFGLFFFQKSACGATTVYSHFSFYFKHD